MSTIPTSHPIHSILNSLTLTPTQHQSILTHLISEFEAGLAADVPTNIPMLPSFVGTLPTGDERGTILTVDFGGTNVRVSSVTLKGDRKFDTQPEKQSIPEDMRMNSDGATLFGLVADLVKAYVEKYKVDVKHAKLAFTFSYATKQTTLNSGTLVRWSKINAPDVVGKDPVQFLNDALRERGVHINVTALVNDTVSTLVGGAYERPETKVGMIVGTGCNAAYMERTSAIPKLIHYKQRMPPSVLHSPNHIINCEWANFDVKGKVLPMTKWDKLQDEATTNKGYNVLEKLMSGQYMGEVVRLILVELWEGGSIGAGEVSEALKTRYKFESMFMDQIERDESPDMQVINSLFTTTFNLPTTPLDRTIIHTLITTISTRSAHLCAIAISALHTLYVSRDPARVNEPFLVAADGSVITKYKGYRHVVERTVREILGEKGMAVSVECMVDASAHGGAVIAAMCGENSV